VVVLVWLFYKERWVRGVGWGVVGVLYVGLVVVAEVGFFFCLVGFFLYVGCGFVVVGAWFMLVLCCVT